MALRRRYPPRWIIKRDLWSVNSSPVDLTPVKQSINSNRSNFKRNSITSSEYVSIGVSVCLFRVIIRCLTEFFNECTALLLYQRSWRKGDQSPGFLLRSRVLPVEIFFFSCDLLSTQDKSRLKCTHFKKVIVRRMFSTLPIKMNMPIYCVKDTWRRSLARPLVRRRRTICP